MVSAMASNGCRAECSAGSSPSAVSAPPRIAESALLKSCATPLAMVPRLASRWTRTS
ncbi:MAG: hypothetical protein QM756_29255 [Polyangiaceae bacterium]